MAIGGRTLFDERHYIVRLALECWRPLRAPKSRRKSVAYVPNCRATYAESGGSATKSCHSACHS